MWKIILCIRESNIGEGDSRTQHIGFSQSIKEVWEGQGSVRGSMLEKEGRLRERIIGKTTVLHLTVLKLSKLLSNAQNRKTQ